MLRHLLGLLPTPVVLGNLGKEMFRDLIGAGKPQGHFAPDLLVEENTWS